MELENVKLQAENDRLKAELSLLNREVEDLRRDKAYFRGLHDELREEVKGLKEQLLEARRRDEMDTGVSKRNTALEVWGGTSESASTRSIAQVSAKPEPIDVIDVDDPMEGTSSTVQRGTKKSTTDPPTKKTKAAPAQPKPPVNAAASTLKSLGKRKQTDTEPATTTAPSKKAKASAAQASDSSTRPPAGGSTASSSKPTKPSAKPDDGAQPKPGASSSSSSTAAKTKTPPTTHTNSTNPHSLVSTYLSTTPNLAIPPPGPPPLYIPRLLMRKAYGGSDQQLLQYLPAESNPSPSINSVLGTPAASASSTANANAGASKKAAAAAKANAGKRRVVWPTRDVNPLMPRSPGEAGLLFASRAELCEEEVGPDGRRRRSVWSVFGRKEGGARGEGMVWAYLGEYEHEVVGTMRGQEFAELGLDVQRNWAKLIMKSEKGAGAKAQYLAMRARIALRKAGIAPSESATEAEMETIKEGEGREVSEEDVLEALRRGDEGLQIVRMKCVAYDRVFVSDIEEKSRTTDLAKAPSIPTAGSSSTTTSTSAAAAASSTKKPVPPVEATVKSKEKDRKKARAKAKQERVPTSEDEEDDEEEDEEEGDERGRKHDDEDEDEDDDDDIVVAQHLAPPKPRTKQTARKGSGIPAGALSPAPGSGGGRLWSSPSSSSSSEDDGDEGEGEGEEDESSEEEALQTSRAVQGGGSKVKGKDKAKTKKDEGRVKQEEEGPAHQNDKGKRKDNLPPRKPKQTARKSMAPPVEVEVVPETAVVVQRTPKGPREGKVKQTARKTTGGRAPQSSSAG